MKIKPVKIVYNFRRNVEHLMDELQNLNDSITQKIYETIFRNVYRRNIDVFLCGGASHKKFISTRDKLKPLLQKNKYVTVLYPEDLFMELLHKKNYDLLSLEKFLADNCDLIGIVCESPGSFVELGAFVNHPDTFEKVVSLVPTKHKNDKSFIMMGPIRHIQLSNRNRVIFYSTDLNKPVDDLSALIKQELFRHWTVPKIKDIDLITGQYYFILFVLYFYKQVIIKDLIRTIKAIYTYQGFDNKLFEIVYSAAIRRLYKDGCIEKITRKEQVYCLSEKGSIMAQTLINDTRIQNRTRIFDGIRLQIIKEQYS
jgi:hypothetical protein